MVAAIETADAMLKAASVRLISRITTNPGMITLVVEGDIGSCRAAVDAGRMVAERQGALVSEKVIGRPEPDLALFLGPPPAPEPVDPVDPVDAIVHLLTGIRNGKRPDQLAALLKLDEHEVLEHLEMAIGQGRLKKSGGRYLIT